MHELVSPDGSLYRVAEGDITDFCEQHRLDRPDNVGRLREDSCVYRFSENWQSLNKMRWLKFVNKKSLLRVQDVALQPVLGETAYFLENHVRFNPNMSKTVDGGGEREHIFIDKEFSRLLGKNPPAQYKCWARAYPDIEEAREYFVNNTFEHQPKVH